jgi:hypothetical protein
MIVYEVNVDLHPSIAEDYLEWLRHHARQMYEMIEGLQTVTISVRDDAPPSPADYEEDDGGDGGEGASKPGPWVGVTSSYLIRTREALADYLAHRAGTMRADAVQRFGTRNFRAHRRIMEVSEVIQPGDAGNAGRHDASA